MAQFELSGDQLANFLKAVPNAQILNYSGNPYADPAMMGYIQRQQQLQQQQQAQQQAMAAQEPGGLLGFAKGIVEGLTDPFVRVGKAGLMGLNQLIGYDPKELAKQYFGNENANVGEELLKGAVGIGSWFVPGMGPTGSLMNVLSRGAIAGGLGSLSRQNFLSEGIDTNKIGEGALMGGLTSGVMYGAGKLYKKLFQPSQRPPTVKKEAFSALDKVNEYVGDQTQQILKGGGDRFEIAKNLGQNPLNQQMNAINTMYNNRLLTANEVSQAYEQLLAQAGNDPLKQAIARQAQAFNESLGDSAYRGLKMVEPTKPGNIFKVNDLQKQLGTVRNEYNATLDKLNNLDESIAQSGMAGQGGEQLKFDLSNKPESVLFAEKARAVEQQIEKILDKPKKMITLNDRMVVDKLQEEVARLDTARLESLGKKSFAPYAPSSTPEGDLLRQKLIDTGQQMRSLESQIGELTPKPLTPNLQSINDDPFNVFIKPGTERIQLSKLNPIERAGLVESYRALGFEPPKGNLDVTGSLDRTIETVETLLRQEGLPRSLRGISDLAGKLGVSRNTLVDTAQGRLIVESGNFIDRAAVTAKDYSGGLLSDAKESVIEVLSSTMPEKALSVDPTGKYEFMPLEKWSAKDLFDITQNSKIKDTALKVLYAKSKATVRPEAAAKAALYDTANNILKAKIPGYREINNGFSVLFEQNEFLRRILKNTSLHNLIKNTNRIQILGTTLPVGMLAQPFWKGVEKVGGAFGDIGRTMNTIGQNPELSNMLGQVKQFAGGYIPSQVGAGQTGQESMQPNNVLGMSTGTPEIIGNGMGAMQPSQVLGSSASPTSTMGVSAPSMGGNYGTSAVDLQLPSMNSTIQPSNAVGVSPLELLAAVNDALGGRVDTLPLAMKVSDYIAPQVGLGGGAGGGMGKLSDATRKNLTSLQLADSALGQFEQNLEGLGLYESGILSKTLGRGREVLSGLGLDENLAYYNDMRQAMSAQLARALGETGVLNNFDIQRALNAIPTITDSKDVAQRKLQFIRGMLGQAQQLALQFNGGGSAQDTTTDEQSLANMLGMMQ